MGRKYKLYFWPQNSPPSCRQNLSIPLSAVSGKLTQSDLEIGFQYGNSMQSFFSKLIDNVWAYQAVKDKLISNSNHG
jgi:hypothetical protein